MRMRRILVKNYRAFYGTNEIDLTSDTQRKEENFTIFVGENGAGKSNLLNALTWCLYKKEIHLTDEDKALPIINTLRLDELEPGEEAEVGVEIEFERDGDVFVFDRRVDVKKLDDGGAHPRQASESFLMREREGNDWTLRDNANFFVESLMPEGIKEYFFFDGEQLNQYFKEASSRRIQSAITDISQIAALEEVIDNLDYVHSQVAKDERKKNPEIEKIGDDLESAQDRIKFYKKEIEEGEENLQEAESQIIEAEKVLSSQTDTNVERLQDRREELKDQIDSLNNRLKRTGNQRRDLIISNAPRILARKAIEDILLTIQDHEDAGRIPARYKQPFIQELLDEGTCICGADLEDGSDQRHKVEQFLARADAISELSDELTYGRAKLEDMLEVTNFDSKRRSLGKQVKSIEEDIEKKSNEMDQISKQLENADIDKIRQAERDRKRWEKEKEDINREIGRIEQKLKEKESERDELKRELQKSLKKEEEYELIVRRLEFLDEAQEVAEAVKQEVVTQVRDRVDELTRQNFFELIWNPEEFHDVSIDEEYLVEVTQKLGDAQYEATGSLSSGQRQVLALSFIAALSNVSGFNAPIVIDTALGRISGEPRDNIASNLPNYLEEKQVIMLLTDVEYTPKVREALGPRVGKEFELIRKEGKTEVVEYGG